MVFSEIDCDSKSTNEIGRGLSNLSPNIFSLDGYKFASFEGFLQSLKCDDDRLAQRLREKSGFDAWKSGQIYNYWKDRQKLYFDNKTYNRDSSEYNDLIARAYNALWLQSENFRLLLLQSGNSILTHKRGHHDTSKTLLTQSEYLSNLYRLRAITIQKEIQNGR